MPWLGVTMKNYGDRAQKQKQSRNMDLTILDSDHNLKRIRQVFSVSTAIQKLIRKRARSRYQSKYQSDRQEQVIRENALRASRLSFIKTREMLILDIAADLLHVKLEVLIQGIIKNDRNIHNLQNFYEPFGTQVLIIGYNVLPLKIVESGWSRHSKKIEQQKRWFVSVGDFSNCERCVIAYHKKIYKSVESIELQDDITFHFIDFDKKNDLIAGSNKIQRVISNFCLQNLTNNNALKSGRKEDFVHATQSFTSLLCHLERYLRHPVIFEVPQNLYKGHMLVPYQILETSRNVDLVFEIEKHFNRWISKISRIIQETKQIKHDSSEVGPHDELEYRQNILINFTKIISFIETKEFNSFLSVLKITKSKLIRIWKEVDNYITCEINEAKDIVRHLELLESFWNPIYRCELPIIKNYLLGLFTSIQNVYKNSLFYNDSVKVVGLIIKVTNQLVLACWNYLTDKGIKTVWTQDKIKLIEKINDCRELQECYLYFYTMTLSFMNNDPSGVAWHGSIVGKFEAFLSRLDKIKTILETSLRFSVLDRSKILGMHTFYYKVLNALNKITGKPYDPLVDPNKCLLDDFYTFQKEIEEIELEMKQFVKQVLNKIPTSESRLLVLKSLESFQLDCLCLNRRYVDIAQMLENEIESLKDIYNERRNNPPIEWNQSVIISRIRWSRNLFNKMNTPMKILKHLDCVIQHKKAQICVKYYNYMASVLLHYELLYHKVWYENAYKIETKLDTPVFSTNKNTNFITVNINKYIPQLIKDSEAMHRMKFYVPNQITTLINAKQTIFNTVDHLNELIMRFNKLREKIPIMLFNLMRPQLKNLENEFAPGFSTITWLSEDLDMYINNVKETLIESECFLKKALDMLYNRIEFQLIEIENYNLIQFPNKPIDSEVFYHMNSSHRIFIGRKIDLKSKSIEKSVIELINGFVDIIRVLDVDSCGNNKFMISFEQLNDKNWRTELTKPINKYDWISFKKIANMVYFPAPEEFEKFRYSNYNEFYYDVSVLHIDCMELFSYYYQKLIGGLVRCTKSSLEKFKEHSRNLQENDSENFEYQPIFLTNAYLDNANCIIRPNLNTINENYQKIVKNIIETHYSISTWGQRAKILPRRNLKKTIDEVRHPKNYFETIFNHQEIKSLRNSFKGGIWHLEKEINKFLKSLSQKNEKILIGSCIDEINTSLEINPKILLKYEYLERFAIDIRDKINELSYMLKDIQAMNCVKNIQSIQINLSLFTETLINKYQQSINILGQFLRIESKKVLEEITKFIEDHITTLNRKLNDLDDIRLTMTCLEEINTNYYDIDKAINNIEKNYALLYDFKFEVPFEEMELVEGVRYVFTNMLQKTQNVQCTLSASQDTLQRKLNEGVHKFVKELDDFNEDYNKNGPMLLGTLTKEDSDKYLLFKSRFDDLWHKYLINESGEKFLGLPINQYPILINRKREFNLMEKLYVFYIKVMSEIQIFLETPWFDINVDFIISRVTEFQNECRRLPVGLKKWPAYMDLKKKIDDLSSACPLLQLISDKSIKQRHWTRLEKILSYKFDIEDASISLGDILQTPLLKFKDDIEDICIGATKENDIEAKLKETIDLWNSIDVPFKMYKEKELLINVKEINEIMFTLENSIVVMHSLANNRYNFTFKKDILLWLWKLVTTEEILEKWLMAQNMLINLESVFVGSDISKQLPMVAKRFSHVDRIWREKIMRRAHESKNLIAVCTDDEIILNLIKIVLEELEVCQKALTGYLESKRLIFPRFFFISDSIMIEILGQSQNPLSIEQYLLSLFDAVANVEFEQGLPDKLISIISKNGERVPLEKPVFCSGGVEIWLGRLLTSIQETIKDILSKTAHKLADSDFNFIAEINLLPGQASLIALQIQWTLDCEHALLKWRNDNLIMRKTNKTINKLLNQLISLTVNNLSSLERIKIETLITIHVHQRDIFDQLCRLKIQSINDFEWEKQMRFYYNNNNDDILIKVTNVDFKYQNEYLGVTERLAITPLTDRCYITLAQAINMSLGGAPTGPAGTGKTETVKDMGKTLGKYVIVFNCSDQLNYQGLGRIFKGLAQSGTWGCFDEFNRIDISVLSVAAQQIHIVFVSKRIKKKEFVFTDGSVVSLNSEFGIFITMNPGYAGRQELPENLKNIFRSVAMMVPDRQIIIRVKLASCGFINNVKLSRKIFILYKLCEEQLSKQVHYDFGLRNILSVLRRLGEQKKENINDTEETIILRVLIDMNMSKLVKEDEYLFNSLIEDLFYGIKMNSTIHKQMQKAIATSCIELELENHNEFNLKVIQLYQISLVRHGIMTLGPTGSGKTKVMNVLLKSFTICKQLHKEIRLNPKAITASQMFGKLDVATNDWTDGIFSSLWRKTLKMKPSEFCWLVLDGPVDAVWIENLNSVLDDNKTLTLANGDRLVMSPNCKLVFEPDNIDNASPATVSRMGMIYISASVTKWVTVLEGWLKTRSSDQAIILKNLFYKNNIFDDLQAFVQMKLKTKMHVNQVMHIQQCCNLLNGLLLNDYENFNFTDVHIERLFLFSLMWSIGGVIESEDHEKFAAFVLSHPSKMKWPISQKSESIFEFVVSNNGNWQHWNEQVEMCKYPDDSVLDFASVWVPTVENVRITYLINLIAKQEKPVLLVGEQGIGKTVIIKCYANEFGPENRIFKSYNFSSATSPSMFQRFIESYMEKRVGTYYGPPQQRKMSIFIDDINMPDIDEWGAQTTNEFVRQLLECKGFFSLDKPGEFSTILDMQLMAAMIYPGGGRNDIPERLKRQFNIFNCTLPSNRSLDKIFSFIAIGYFCSSRFSQEIVDCIPKLVPLIRMIWQNTKIKMLPTPAKFHYSFNLRDLSRIWQGMTIIQGSECKSIETLMKLWRHECSRVINDRFINLEDRSWFTSLMNSLQKQVIPEYEKYFPTEDTFFVDFLRDLEEPTNEEVENYSYESPKVYEEIQCIEVTTKRVLMYMNKFNEQSREKIELVFFKDALIHLIIISRIIRTPSGNALLVGIAGSGKQSLAQLASFIAGHKFHRIMLTSSYNVSNFCDDLKYLYRVAGLQGQGISFIFTDNDIKDENFLEFLNNILSTGEIANLFNKDELDEMLNGLIGELKMVDSKRPRTIDNLYDFFIKRFRTNVHIVLCFSPVSEKFRKRALKFPNLISGCTIDFFQEWPSEALNAVSEYFLSNFDMVCSYEVKSQVKNVMAMVQKIVCQTSFEYYNRLRRQIHVTPKSFLSFLDSYKKLYFEKKQKTYMLSDRMSVGIVKLNEAAETVEKLKAELELQNENMRKITKSAEQIMAETTTALIEADKIKLEVIQQNENVKILLDEIFVKKIETEKFLAAALPSLEKAQKALQSFSKSDIDNLRALRFHSYMIMTIMDVCLILFKEKLDKVAISDTGFPQPSDIQIKKIWGEKCYERMKYFNGDTINAEDIDLMQPYIRVQKYNEKDAEYSCQNLKGVLVWTIAMIKYYQINKNVIPLKNHLAVLERKSVKANAQLDKLSKLLEKKMNEADKALKENKNAEEKVKFARDQFDVVQHQLHQSLALIKGLESEKLRWIEQSIQFKNEIDRLVGDIIILTGFLSYAGPFNKEYRNLLLEKWQQEIILRKIPISSNKNLIHSLVDDVTISEWSTQGLPNDNFSVQNAIIATKANRFPLLIDPQAQGKLWIQKIEKKCNLHVTSFGDKNFKSILEKCISLGFSILIQDTNEDLDPALDNILENRKIKIGNTYKVKLADKEIDYDVNFRLFITTKLSNPSYTPEIFARTSVIDFSLTMKGLEEQLLERVISIEKQEIESERIKLMNDVSSNKRKIEELKENLLQKLSNVYGSLLDDISLVEILNVSKQTSIEIQEKLRIAKITETKINIAREEFRPVATRGSIIYFVISDMALVNCMYQTSLLQFLERFDISIAKSEKNLNKLKRIASIIDYLTRDIFKYKTRGLYENHKLLFLLLMTLRIDMQQQIISYQEFQIFIKGGAALDIKKCPRKPFKWITDVTWLNLVQLSAVEIFSNILENISHNEKQWKFWLEQPNPEKELYPGGYSDLDAFRKLLIIRSWCPDRFVFQSREYIKTSLGKCFLEPVVTDFDDILVESKPLTPIICLLTMGADPTQNIEKLAKKNGIKVNCISMGQGQRNYAKYIIASSLENGSWVLLQNCHLDLAYLNELTTILVEMDERRTGFHPGFRIWITTESHSDFPITLLHLSIKYTNEPPVGIRASLRRTYKTISTDVLEHNDSPLYLSLIFTISLLHTILQERRKFGALGWNIPYEFNSTDWLALCFFVQNHFDVLNMEHSFNMNSIRYMFGEIHYGGRVTDEYDKRLLNSFSKIYFNNRLFENGFEFYTGYKVMAYKYTEEYLRDIEKYEAIDPPGVYGLHANADITYQINTTESILKTIMSMQPKESSGNELEHREELVAQQSQDLLSKLPPNYDLFEVEKILYGMGQFNSMNTFLKQEIERIQKIIIVVRTTLQDLLLAIEGSIIMNIQLQDCLHTIFDARVPIIWQKISWESSSIGFWFTELLERNNQFKKWCFEGRPNMFWMAGFFNPQGFLTSIKQEIAHFHQWPLDQVSISNKEGIYVYDLYLHGAGWNKRKSSLIESKNKILYTLMPVILIDAMYSTTKRCSMLYECPLYKKKNRTALNFITPLWLNCPSDNNKGPDHWILRGVALLCDIK
uniref:CSON013031 protein n=1 Tax=Culicoides sonorensis TaxID=179676 RepID=A0A336MB49_CULSO